MTDQPASSKIPGDPLNCPVDVCKHCEYFELCHSVVAPKNVNIDEIRREIAERDRKLFEASRSNSTSD